MDKITGFKKEYSFLSNFYNCSIKYKGQIFRNAESAFQAAKCIDKTDRIRFVAISAKDAKKLGRKIKLRADWEEVKENIMYKIIKAKFEQHSYLKMKLLNTDNYELIQENNWGDVEWGVSNGKGENKLGKILMKVREELRILQ